MPSNRELERRLAVTMCIYPELAAKLQLAEGDFYDNVARTIYRACSDLLKAGKEVNLVSVADQCGDAVKPSTLAGIAQERLLEYEVEAAADIIRKDSKRRAAIRLANMIEAGARDSGQDIDELCQMIQLKLTEIAKNRTTDWESNRDLLIRHYGMLEERYTHGGVLGVRSGFTDLDEITSGFQPGQLIFLGAAPKMGKTSFALHVALNCRVPVLFFTLEMLPEELADRELASTARVNAKLIRTGMLGEEAWRRIADVLPELCDKEIYWVKQSGLSVIDIRGIAMRCKEEHGLGLIVIDQLDKI
ncbi:MAG: hypothetical protein HPY71_14410, partial [Firmicutes bacterium]|nr:hypothetical protein [Bacillota bacterium]